MTTTEQSHKLIQDNRDLVLRALDGDTSALGQLLSKAYLAGEVEGLVRGTQTTAAALGAQL